jgi:two-component system chemotaxis response regulator CheY
VEKKKRSIVFVDDDKVQHMINRRILKKLNLEVEPIFFDKPYEAIEWLSMNHADVVLLDINMPEMDGRELSEFIRFNPETTHIPIIMVTSESSTSSHMTNIQQTGVNALCDKPFESDEVRKILARLLDQND